MNKALFSKIKIPLLIIGIILILYVALWVLTWVLTYMPKGRYENAEISIGESDIFSPDDFEQAEKAIFTEFENYGGCEMLTLVYDESMSNEYKNDYYSEYNGSEIMVLYSDFKTQKHMHESCFNDDCLYRNWKWIMVKSGGEWIVRDRGLP